MVVQSDRVWCTPFSFFYILTPSIDYVHAMCGAPLFFYYLLTCSAAALTFFTTANASSLFWKCLFFAEEKTPTSGVKQGEDAVRPGCTAPSVRGRMYTNGGRGCGNQTSASTPGLVSGKKKRLAVSLGSNNG
jgi:hypothetical protein